MTGESRCPPSPGHEATRDGGAPARSGGSGDTLWWQKRGYNPSSPPNSGTEGERGRTGLYAHLPAPCAHLAGADPGGVGTHPSTHQVGARVQAPGSPHGWQPGWEHRCSLAPSTAKLPSAPAPPQSGPAQAAPCAWGCPHPAPPCTCRPRVPPCRLGGKRGAVLCRAVPCRAERDWGCCSLHATSGRTGRVTR